MKLERIGTDMIEDIELENTILTKLFVTVQIIGPYVYFLWKEISQKFSPCILLHIQHQEITLTRKLCVLLQVHIQFIKKNTRPSLILHNFVHLYPKSVNNFYFTWKGNVELVRQEDVKFWTVQLQKLQGSSELQATVFYPIIYLCFQPVSIIAFARLTCFLLMLWPST